MTTDADSYRGSHQAAGYGDFYEQTIFSGYAGDLWRRREEPLLDLWLRSEREAGATTALDFACGTGRITDVVARHFTTTGVDVSAEMLRFARERCPEVTFVERDITGGDLDGLPTVDVATAFRFFMNAEPPLRDAVVTQLARLVRPGGSLITNVQVNADGPAGLVQRARRELLHHDVHAMAHDELATLLTSHGFEVEQTAWYGFWPRTGPFLGSLAARLQGPMERAVRRWSLPQERLAQMFMVRARRVGGA